MEGQEIQNANIKEEQSRRTHITRLQGLLLIKTVGYWQWREQIGQRNRIEEARSRPINIGN